MGQSDEAINLCLEAAKSHELGQPITNIRYTVQFYKKLFQKKIDSTTLNQVFDSILEETERMGGLVKRFSPLTSSKIVIEKFDLIDRIQKRASALNTKIQTLEISVQISPETPIFLTGDPVKFDQLISNLFLNAIDAIRERKIRKKNQILIQVREKREDIQITFSDNGIGIPVRNRGKIFDPFFSTKSPGKGEGLGLFSIWNLLKIQGGKIILDAKYKAGARFFITLPKGSKNQKE